MRLISLSLLGLTQIALFFSFDRTAFAVLVLAAAVVISLKAATEGRRSDRVSIAIFVLAILSSIVSPLLACQAAVGAEWMLELELDGRKIEGKPLSWSRDQVTLLGRDGRLWEFPPARAANFRKTSPSFDSYTQGELRAQLLREFGAAFEVSGTGNYLVVHPRGERDQWARRFEDLYRSFVHYVAVRGLQPQPLEFPLVAVVFPSQQDFLKYTYQQNHRPSRGVLGYYSPTTNRILMYDSVKSQSNGDWSANAETIIHEAAHQAAFNTGVHSRYELPTRWVVEGLGTLFEAPGVWDSRAHPERRQRINPDQLEAFRQRLPQRPKGFLPQFVASDRTFTADPRAAYAEAWALTFFLSETRPRQYSRYLSLTASGKGGLAARAAERLKVFTDVFGDDLAMLELRYLRYIERL